MNEDGKELVKRIHREALESYREQREREKAVVEAAFREALERQREQRERERALVEKVHREAVEHFRSQPLPPTEPPSLHFTELPDAKNGTRRTQMRRIRAHPAHPRHLRAILYSQATTSCSAASTSGNLKL